MHVSKKMSVKNDNSLMDRVKLLLLGMQYCGFKGEYFDDGFGNIKWILNDSLEFEIRLAGRALNDFVIVRLRKPNGKMQVVRRVKLKTSDNYELIKVLREYNNSEIQINENAFFFGRKYGVSLVKKSDVDEKNNVRDFLMDGHYWKEHIERIRYGLFELEEQLKTVRPERLKDCRLFVEQIRLDLLISLYSSGADIEECKKLYKINLNNISQCLDKFESYVDLIWYLSLGVLLNIESPEIKILNNMINSSGASNDKLVCYFMKYLNGNYQNGEVYIMKKPYEFLDRLLCDDVDDLKNYMIEYSKKWYRAHSFEYWYDSHEKKDLYFGYWCFELGALIKIKGLNNESLRDVKYYPYDLVEF